MSTDMNKIKDKDFKKRAFSESFNKLEKKIIREILHQDSSKENTKL